MKNVKFDNSTDGKILAYTDFLIGDMSDINYEYLLTNRPVIILSNKWLINNLPKMGPFCNKITDVENTVKNLLENPTKHSVNYNKIKNLAYVSTESNQCALSVQAIAKRYDISQATFNIIDNQLDLYKGNLDPLYKWLKSSNFKVTKNLMKSSLSQINIAAHCKLLNGIDGTKLANIHFDHGLKGKGTYNYCMGIDCYRENNYYPNIDLHVVAGEYGFRRTKECLNNITDKIVVGGYPKGDTILNELKNIKAKKEFYKSNNLNWNSTTVMYAPSGLKSNRKPGGSLSISNIIYLVKLCKQNNWNFIFKQKKAKMMIKEYFLKYLFQA